jgi:hypothetical protein
MEAVHRLIKFARKSPLEQWRSLCYHLAETDLYWKIHSPGKDRTAYIIGLFGSGRLYINGLILQNFPERAKYFREENRAKFHVDSGPTSMIHSCHATMKYVSRGQKPPAVTSRISKTVRLGFADLIFIYRHPLDSLVSNWVWWRTFVREHTMIFTSQLYTNTDALCAILEENFSEFKAFADGDPRFFPDPERGRFLSFPEFVEETGLFLQAASLAVRLEDFMSDPVKEFSKIVRLMSVDLDVNRLQVPPPKTKPYRYLAVQEKVPQFKQFVNELDRETRSRIERIGYALE